MTHPNRQLVVAALKSVITAEEPLVLYHGTLREDLPKIKAEGLKPSEGWGGANTEGVFLSESKEGALYWAKLRFLRDREMKLEENYFDQKFSEQEKNLLALLEVTITADQFGNLSADMEQAEDVGFEGGEDDWQASLDEIGDVVYKLKIPPSGFKEVTL